MTTLTTDLCSFILVGAQQGHVISHASTVYAASNETSSAAIDPMNISSSHDHLLKRLQEIHPQQSAPKVDPKYIQKSPPLNKLTLKSVQVYFRHGARLPLKTIPNVEEAFWDKNEHLTGILFTNIKTRIINQSSRQPVTELSRIEGVYRKHILRGGVHSGQLTNLGQWHTYDLGLRLHKDYIVNNKLLPENYQPNFIRIRSTNISRTVDSIRCVMCGLYGVEQLKQHNEVLDVPVETEAGKEFLNPSPRNCPTLHQAYQRGRLAENDIPGIIEFKQRLSLILDYEEGGLEHHKLDLIDIRDDMVARQAHGLPLPDGFTKEVIEKIEHYGTAMCTQILCGKLQDGKIGLILGSGPIFQNVLRNMDDTYHNKSGVKIYLYSCHDSTLIPLLEALELFDNKWPPYAADVRFELYEDQLGDHWVRILYCDQVLPLSGSNGPLCRLEQFTEQISHLAINAAQYDHMCHPHIPQRHIMDNPFRRFWEKKEIKMAPVS
ncbi:lysophosphatidic acid phosphatase type 6-like isoform X2 [Tubulanus polymorphus]|uniref:lysophosphatidic acid phosphatase type 6-like isoform X2 n=1 Tax=Tubulanus polymorphus TaxID=672921 RepID=UPI003DA65C3C